MKLLSTNQAAARLGVALPTITQWCRRGLFSHAQKIGRDWIIPEADLVKFKKPKVGHPKGRPRPSH